jgi:hypothetical protein
MGLSPASLARFRSQVDATLAGFFPATLLIGGVTVQAMSPGARQRAVFVDTGEASILTATFRIPRAALPSRPYIGQPFSWLVEAGQTLLMEVEEISPRPHEDRWTITGKVRRA